MSDETAKVEFGRRSSGRSSGTRVPARPPGRPRSERAAQAILDATLDLLGETGVAGLSIEAVAARAGVGKTTIYRRWSGKDDLIIDALASLKAPAPEPLEESVREDLVAQLNATRATAGDMRSRCAIGLVMGEGDRYPHLVERFHADVVEPRREVLRGVLRRGVASGELRADLDVDAAAVLLSGAMMMTVRECPLGEQVPESAARRIVDLALDGLGGPRA
ncbi:MAG: TetR family transcriptional regulator [Streptosporangiales bacterium]|nr:TetR family transcriptional regulator [Streptosporangiales bacterium]